ncbi:hypothetical protein RIE95_17915 [Acidithiobacillus thiooxidans]|uniref:hypothetical protein n=1 Tax=Acidithiobacillus thiooxidans TaxID=930 RepID=UPI00285BD8E1|nr:hypothetical protein [Acidithiobacillus thiooxidans]MDR7928835.1 hypothetical protein [Acidithiobacillus thiooxidans]
MIKEESTLNEQDKNVTKTQNVGNLRRMFIEVISKQHFLGKLNCISQAQEVLRT